TLPGFLDLVDVLPQRVAPVQVHQQQIREPVDCRNQVVKVVRQPARQPADRIHFLGVQQLLFQVLALGYVPGVYDDSGNRLISEKGGISGLNRAPGTVPMLDSKLGRNAGLSALIPPVPGSGHRPHVARVDQREYALADQFFGGVPEDSAGGGTGIANETLRAEHGDHIGRVLDQGPKPLLALGYLFLSALSIRDIPSYSLYACRLAVPVYQPAANLEKQPLSVLGHCFQLVGCQRVGSDQLALEHLPHDFGFAHSQQGPYRAIQQLLAPVTCDPLASLIERSQITREVQRVHNVVGILEQIPVALLAFVQRRFRFPATGNVPDDTLNTNRPPISEYQVRVDLDWY